MAGKDPRLAEPMREKKAQVVNQEHCQLCFDGGDLVCCHGCPRSYHYECLPEEFRGRTKGFQNFYCPQHECVVDGKKTSDAGGLVFRCRWCPDGYCEDCLDWDNTTLVGDNLLEYETLGFPAVEQAFYIVCPSCNEHHHESPEARTFFEQQADFFQAGHASQADAQAGAMDYDGRHTDHSSRAESMTEATTLSSSGVSTPRGSLKPSAKPSESKARLTYGATLSSALKRKGEDAEPDEVVLSRKTLKLRPEA